MKAAYRFRIPDDVTLTIRGLHPDLKRKVRTAFRLLADDAHAGKALRGELAGLCTLRAGRLRIIYKPPAGRVIAIVAVGPRERIYEETLRLLRKPPGGDSRV
jgi:mRNA interferase RelE/StbE